MAEEIEYGEEGGILAAIKEGMNVYDVEGDEVGEVDFVYLGTTQVEDGVQGVSPGTQTGASLELPQSKSWVEQLGIILELKDPAVFPEVVAERLLRNGFVRVDEGFLSGDDRFILPDQIAGLDDDGVHLNVEGDELVEEW